MKAIIFVGGVGSRLWPLSRTYKPKQFLKLIDNKTMMQLCYDRIHSIFNEEDIYVATAKEGLDAITTQLPNIPMERIHAEPALRNLGPAIGLNAALIAKNNPTDPIMYVWGADQIFRNESEYARLIKASDDYLKNDPNKFIFFGETPRYPNQNIGWFAFGDSVHEVDGVSLHTFDGFHGKPDRENALKYTSDGVHAWNIGDFMTTPQFVLDMYKEYVPDQYEKLMTIQAAYGTDSFDNVLEEVYPTMDNFHQDDSIFEKMDKKHALTVAGPMGWSDIGTWDAYKEAYQESPEKPLLKGKTFEQSCGDVLLYNDDDETLVVGLDLDDIVVVNTKDVVFVGKKSSIHNIKSVVKIMKESDEYNELT